MRTTLIPVTAAFGGLAMFMAIFVVASTMGLSIQQREREIALLRAVAATPRQIRRMIAWEAAIVGLLGSAAGIWPGILLGRALGHALVRHGIVPPNFTVGTGWLPAAAAVVAGVAIALLAVLAAGRRAARVPPTLALTNAAAEPRLLGPGRLIGGLLALAAAVPLFTVSATTGTPQTAAATSGSRPSVSWWRSPSWAPSWPAWPPCCWGGHWRLWHPLEASWPPPTWGRPRAGSPRPAPPWCSLWP